MPKSSLRINCAASDGSTAWNRFTNQPRRLKSRIQCTFKAPCLTRPGRNGLPSRRERDGSPPVLGWKHPAHAAPFRRAVDFFASERLRVRLHSQSARYLEPPPDEIQKGV